ncbi:MAG: AsmA family protein [Leptothrix sp. (in: b-proteobacteria)]
MALTKAAAAAALGLALTTGALVWGESSGWPWLAAPLERTLSATLDRQVRLSAGAGPGTAAPHPFQVRFLGGLRVSASQLEIAAPPWSATPHLLRADDVLLELRYIDLWRAHRGQPLRIERLQARTLDANAERLADGRASWHFGPAPTPGAPAQPMPLFGLLKVGHGTLHYRDALLDSDLQAQVSLVEAAVPAAAPAPPNPASGAAAAARQPAPVTSVFRLSAEGRHHQLPVKIALVSSGLLPWMADTAPVVPVALTLAATVGRASLDFKGSAADVLHLSGLSGHFSLRGPSLAAVGDPLGVTLPTTAAFRTEGNLIKQGDTWRVVIADATVGASQLRGSFTYEAARSVPLLSGQLGGTRLLLADLGPVVGTTSAAVAASGAPAAARPARPTRRASTPHRARVLPDRAFDLAALRAMDADVAIDIVEVNLNTPLLEPLHPLRTHLQLAGGVLSLTELDARTGQGRVTGEVRLDGRGSTALWRAHLRWDGVRLEHWIHQQRPGGAPPFVSGGLNGRASLEGQGQSTAAILADLKGQIHTELRDGAVSHLMVEAAGLDLAQALGVMLKGDDQLPVPCAVADLVATGGVLRPRVMVLDTRDSVIWIDGSLSMASEAIDLRAVVSPKDFSPLTLRTPLRVRGSFAAPEVSIDKAPMARKLAAALLLALLNPLAALIPFIDPGDDAATTTRTADACQSLRQRSTGKQATAVHRQALREISMVRPRRFAAPPSTGAAGPA